MPHTVPSRPTKGAVAPTVASQVRPFSRLADSRVTAWRRARSMNSERVRASTRREPSWRWWWAAACARLDHHVLDEVDDRVPPGADRHDDQEEQDGARDEVLVLDHVAEAQRLQGFGVRGGRRGGGRGRRGGGNQEILQHKYGLVGLD